MAIRHSATPFRVADAANANASSSNQPETKACSIQQKNALAFTANVE
jgi:hypothetical protein